MGRIVSGGVRRRIVEPNNTPGGNTWPSKQLCIGKNIRYRLYGNAILKVEENIDVIREHFGVNKTDALRIALHVMAKGIKEGRYA